MDHIWCRALTRHSHPIFSCLLLPVVPHQGISSSQPAALGVGTFAKGARVPGGALSVAPDGAPAKVVTVMLLCWARHTSLAMAQPPWGWALPKRHTWTKGCMHRPILGENLWAEQGQYPTALDRLVPHHGQACCGLCQARGGTWPSGKGRDAEVLGLD